MTIVTIEDSIRIYMCSDVIQRLLCLLFCYCWLYIAPSKCVLQCYHDQEIGYEGVQTSKFKLCIRPFGAHRESSSPLACIKHLVYKYSNFLNCFYIP